MPAAHILIVDDDRDTREMYRVVFEASGYCVSEAASVANGVELTGRVKPAVVLTDWRLADANGFALCESLHRHGATRQVPIVAATGMSLSPDEAARARGLGCLEVLTKPVDIEVLLSSVNRAIGTSTARRLRALALRAERYVARIPGRHSDLEAIASAMVAHLTRRARPDVALIVADDRGRYVAANESAASLTGYDRRELTRLSVWDITPEPGKARARELWARFIGSGNQEGDYVVRRRDGKPVHTQYVAIANISPGLHLSALSADASSRQAATQ